MTRELQRVGKVGRRVLAYVVDGELEDQTGGGVGGSVIVDITPAQLFAMNSTPVEIVPAQGERTIIRVSSVTMIFKAGTAGYGGDNQSELQLGFGVQED